MKSGAFSEVFFFLYIIFIEKDGYLDKKYLEGKKFKIIDIIKDKNNLVSSLSGGNQQKVVIGKWKISDPEILILDEATSALDANNEKKSMEKLDEFYKGRTVVVVAHRLSTVKNADQIIVLDQGEIAEIRNHKELTAKKGLYYALVKNQLEYALGCLIRISSPFQLEFN